IPILTQRAVLENYRREVEYMDGQLGRLLRALAKSPAASRTAVVVFADHGEGLGEREGFVGHVRFLNRQFIHVPLLVRLPGEKPRRIESPVSLLEVPCWLSDILGIRGSRLSCSGASWSRLRRGDSGREPLYSFTFAAAAGSDLCSVISWPFQLIVSRDPKTGVESREYYDLRLAAERKMDAVPAGLIARQAPALWRQLESSRPAWQGAFARRARPASQAGLRQVEKLKTLGYIRQP
ncbi:MAG TPA: sulfatase-like hydrolase/transferase, partial [Acidobacteriota bacterium]